MPTMPRSLTPPESLRPTGFLGRGHSRINRRIQPVVRDDDRQDVAAAGMGTGFHGDDLAETVACTGALMNPCASRFSGPSAPGRLC
jgi:hypothetical protein